MEMINKIKPKVINRLYIVLIAFLSVLIYSNTFSVPFQFDDLSYIESNTGIKNFDVLLESWQKGLGIKARIVGLYTFFLNYHFHKFTLFGYHLVNLLIHVLNGILVFLVTKLILSSRKINRNNVPIEDESLVAFLVAILFVVHPIQTQAVTYISQRFASLATLFYLLSVYFYCRARLSSTVKGRVVSFTIAFSSAVLGLFTKEIVFTLPIMILLIEGFFFSAEGLFNKKKAWIKIIFCFAIIFLLLIVPWAFKFDVNKVIFGYEAPSQSHAGDVITFENYFITQFKVIITYLRLLMLPVNQNLDYDYPVSKTLFEPATFISFLAIVAILLFGFLIYKKNRLISFGIFWFFITSSVESSIIPIRHVIFEHRIYLPSFGFFLVFVYFFYSFIRNRKAFIWIMASIILVFSLLTYTRNEVWKTPLSLWQDVVKKSPNKARPYLNLGNAFEARGNYYDAIRNYNKSLDLNPLSFMAYSGRGMAFQEIGRYNNAISDFTKAVAIEPSFAEGYNNRGYLYWLLNENDLALQDFNRAISENQYLSNAYNNRGILFKSVKKYSLALDDLTKAIDVQYNNYHAYYNRANLYREMNSLDKAITDYSEAIKYNPGYIHAINNRGSVYLQKDELDLARLDYDLVIKLNQDFPNSYYNRAIIYFKKGDYRKAYSDLVNAKLKGFAIDDNFMAAVKAKVKE